MKTRPLMPGHENRQFVRRVAKCERTHLASHSLKLKFRSAVYWADQINVPVLIPHSRTNKLPVTQALRMAGALQER